MAADSTILREYLVALGFQVNQTDAKKFDEGLARWDKRANQLGKALIGAGTAAAGMVAQFAWSMEKLYYASRRTDSAVGSIQALEYGARRVGVSGDRMRGALESMARNMRANPGLQGLLNSLGVKVTGRDKSDVLVDLVTQLKKMPFYVAEKYANLFGIDPDTLFMLQDGLDELKKARAERAQMAAEMGVDTEKAALASKEFANQWREITERAGIFRDALAIELLPLMHEMAKVTAEVLKDWTQIIKQPDAMTRFLEGIGIKPTGGGVELSKESKARLGQAETEGDTYEGTNLGTGEKVVFRKKWLDRQIDKLLAWGGAKRGQAPTADQASVDAAQDLESFKRGGTGPRSYVPNGRGGYVYQPQAGSASPGASGGTAALFARLEQKYGLTPGTLDRIWAAESNRGDPRWMTSNKGAKGHFGIMDATAQDLGIDKDGGRADRDNVETSADAAARYFGQLKKRYSGDDSKAAAAYNWGMGNVDRYGLGAAPAETQQYMNKVAPQVNVTQQNSVTVNAANNPQSVAQAVGTEMRTSNADVVRNMRPKVQ